MTTLPNAPAQRNLTYYIFEGVLVGSLGKHSIHVYARSGGGGGTTKGGIQPGVANNVYATGMKTSPEGPDHLHGGPIPRGRYRVYSPSMTEKKFPDFVKKVNRAAFLEPDTGNSMMGRGGFYIHGRGKHGSDGCIVPLNQFQELMDALEESGGGTLYVEETFGGSRFA